MRIFPAIDLIGQQVVRLTEGEFERVDVYGDAETLLSRWQGHTEVLHMIDLEGARSGVPTHLNVLRTAKALGYFVQCGGGVRSESALEEVMATGVDRVLLGTKAFTDEPFLRNALERYGARVAVALDARDGNVRLNGWQDRSDLRDEAEIVRLEGLGVRTVLYTDIARDGRLEGPSIERLQRLRHLFSGELIASGGVRDEADVAALRAIGVDACVIGKALLSGQVAIEDVRNWGDVHA